MTKGKSSGNAIVDAMATVEITGNITPLSWYHEILLENGRTDAIGIMVLADIVYWYRPTIQNNELGETIMKKKFKWDLLQRSYDQIADRLNLTKEQARTAVKRLEEGGFIKRDFRTEMHNGTKCANVMYLELIPERIKAVTYSLDESMGVSVSMQTPISEKTDTPIYETIDPSVNSQTPVGLNTQTKTKNTTEITTKDFTSINLIRKGFREQIEYDSLIIDLPFSKYQIDEIVEVATEVLSSEKPYMRVDGESRPIEFVKERFRRLDMESIKYVIESLRKYVSGVTNVKAFMVTTLFNAPTTQDTYIELKVNKDLAI